MQNTIAAGEFKAKCLQLMDQVYQQHSSLIITKRGIPIAKLVPFEKTSLATEKKLFGSMKDTLTISGDIVSPLEVSWSAEDE